MHCLHDQLRASSAEGTPHWLIATQHNDLDNNLWHTVLQTDGWFSEKSASIYEASTETLFLGRQDAMQRQSLVPLHRFMQARSPGRDTKGDNTKMLEVACGTGRFATFVKVLSQSVRDFTVIGGKLAHLTKLQWFIRKCKRARMTDKQIIA